VVEIGGVDGLAKAVVKPSRCFGPDLRQTGAGLDVRLIQLGSFQYVHFRLPDVDAPRLIDLARAEPVAVAKHRRPVVLVMAVEEFDRLKALDVQATAPVAKRNARERPCPSAELQRVAHELARGFVPASSCGPASMERRHDSLDRFPADRCWLCLIPSLITLF